MKLAEALSIRADLQKRVAQLKERIKVHRPPALWHSP